MQRAHDPLSILAWSLLFTLLSIAAAGTSSAQDWGGQGDDGWSQPTLPQSGYQPNTGWSARVGIGFIDDPNAFLLNFEAPYAFDQWVAAGPGLQVGIDDNNTVIAPTLNVTVTIPDLPGDDFDRLHPYGLIGIGFAYIEDDNRRNDNSSAGFLIDFGVGLEFEISEVFSIGTQMMFNFLPEETLDEDFFYSWQVGGIRISF